MQLSFEPAEIVTRDRLVHQGFFRKPTKSNGVAILWIHGLTGRFYGDMEILKTLAPVCEQNGWALASFNNRGHDLLTNIHKLDSRKKFGYSRVLGGSGVENFTNCLLDIDAAIDFLVRNNYPKILVLGISTGANKLCYYAAKRRNTNLTGVVLISPMSDRLSKHKNRKEMAKKLKVMKKLAHQRKGNELTLDYYYPITPNRFLSLHEPNTPEDCFDYGDQKPNMTLFSKIKKPLMVVLAGSDEHADRRIPKIKAVFDAKATSPNYQSVLIPGASHTYVGKEKELVTEISAWIKSPSQDDVL